MLHTVWFHLYKSLGNVNFLRIICPDRKQMNQRLPGAEEGGRVKEEDHESTGD